MGLGYYCWVFFRTSNSEFCTTRRELEVRCTSCATAGPCLGQPRPTRAFAWRSRAACNSVPSVRRLPGWLFLQGRPTAFGAVFGVLTAIDAWLTAKAGLLDEDPGGCLWAADLGSAATAGCPPLLRAAKSGEQHNLGISSRRKWLLRARARPAWRPCGSRGHSSRSASGRT